MGVEVTQTRADAPRLATSPWPYFAAFVAATWVIDLVWHSTSNTHDSTGAITISWLVMTAAMMTPTTVPMLSALADVVGRREHRAA
ncbi:MAG: hypothetical protein EBY93_06620, partial [Actinobacteria bacterium]|nr:hypothetical protein [Actinomycetota bacterium]